MACTYHFHLDPIGQLEVEELMAELRVILVEFIEFSLLEKQDSVVVVLLDLPKLCARLVKSQPRGRQCSTGIPEFQTG